MFWINEEIIAISVPFVKQNIFERIIDTFDLSIRSVIICMDKAHAFNKISFISILIYFVLINFCFFILKLNLEAYTIARLAKTLSEVVMLY